MKFETRGDKDKKRFRRSDFYRLVRRYELEAENYPAKYRLRVMAVALGGYAYLSALVLLVAGSIALLVRHHLSEGWSWWMLAAYLAVGSLAIIMVRTFLIPFSMPNAFELDLAHFPSLRDAVKEAKRRLRIWRTPGILLTDEVNAFALSRPWLGLFGPARHYVGLGIPLLHALNLNEISLVLAHEMAHLSRMHSRWTGWIHRLRLTWFELLYRLGQTLFGRIFLLPFAKWYWGYFDAITVVLSRRQENEANIIASRAYGRDSAVVALARMAVVAHAENEYWESLWQGSIAGMPLPKAAVTRLCEHLRSWDDSDGVRRALRKALSEKTPVGSTHPALSDSLHTLKFTGDSREGDLNRILEHMKMRVKESATDKLTPKRSIQPIVEIFDERWRLYLEPIWTIRQRQAVHFRDMLLDLNGRAEGSGALSPVKRWRQACLVQEFYGLEKAIPFVRDVLERDGDHPTANFVLGQYLLDEGDASGATMVTKAVAMNPMLKAEGKHLIADHYWQQGALDKAERLEFEAMNAADTLDRVFEERAAPAKAKDILRPHHLPEDSIADLVDLVSGTDRVRRVYVVQKVTRHLPDAPFYVIGVEPMLGWGSEKRRMRKEQLEFELGIRFNFDASHQIVVFSPRQWRLRRKMKKVPDSEIWNSRGYL